MNLAGVLAYESEPGKRAELARKWYRGTPDPYALHLWDWTREDRAWATLNDLLTVLLELDDIADKGNPLEGSLVGGSATRGNDRAVSATPAEQDLLDFLREDPPYFGPGDLGVR